MPAGVSTSTARIWVRGTTAAFVDDGFSDGDFEISEIIDECNLIIVHGDVNESGALTSADIIHMVGFVFKGGQPPEPCVAAADINCDGAVTSSDIIYMVNHVFKGGPAPCDICNETCGDDLRIA